MKFNSWYTISKGGTIEYGVLRIGVRQEKEVCHKLGKFFMLMMVQSLILRLIERLISDNTCKTVFFVHWLDILRTLTEKLDLSSQNPLFRIYQFANSEIGTILDHLHHSPCTNLVSWLQILVSYIYTAVKHAKLIPTAGYMLNHISRRCVPLEILDFGHLTSFFNLRVYRWKKTPLV